MTSRFIQHEACPSCGSRDNLARYDDGHAWCFGCGYSERGTVSYATTIMAAAEQKQEKGIHGLPADFSYSIDYIGKTWLDKYSLTNSEIRSNKIGWSIEGVYFKKKDIHIHPMLIFPVFDIAGNLLFWQGRNFGDEGPKYMTFGYKEKIYHILENNAIADTIVLTEDLVSAIKVSRVCSTMPLFGSTVSLERLKTLSARFKHLRIWLDMDKVTEALKTRLKASLLFETAEVIVAEKDPKEYNTEDIRNFLRS